MTTVFIHDLLDYVVDMSFQIGSASALLLGFVSLRCPASSVPKGARKAPARLSKKAPPSDIFLP